MRHWNFYRHGMLFIFPHEWRNFVTSFYEVCGGPEVRHSIPINLWINLWIKRFFPYLPFYVFFVAQCSATSSNHTFGGGVVLRQTFVRFWSIPCRDPIKRPLFSMRDSFSLRSSSKHTFEESKAKKNNAKVYSTAKEWPPKSQSKRWLSIVGKCLHANDD